MNQRLRDKLKELQQQSEQLEPSEKERKKLTQKVVQYSERFYDELPDKKVYEEPKSSKESLTFSFDEEPASMDDLLSVFKENVEIGGLTSASGGHLGYIPGGGLYPSALGDFLAAVTNEYAGVSFAGPGAVKMERECVNWLCDLIGYSDTAGGNLTSGGSIANLIALANARDNADITSRDYHKTVIYTTHQVHHCIIKAIKFAGLTDARLRLIDMDEKFRMKTGSLISQIKADRQQGLIPLIIFASAGTTDVGAVDPLEEMAKIAEKHNIWFHVDAAYGGAFLLTDYGKEMMKGIKKADSVTVDPHKGLFLPYGTGALLVKDVKKLRTSQHMHANYLQDTYREAEISPADLSPELSKHFRALRMWLPLKLFGIAPLRAALNEKLLLTRYAYNELKKIDYIQTGPTPQLSIMHFRYVPQEGDANAFNKELTEKIHQDGRIFLSSTHIDETVYLRLAVLSFRTHLETIDRAIAVLKEKINELTTRTVPVS